MLKKLLNNELLQKMSKVLENENDILIKYNKKTDTIKIIEVINKKINN